jgi:hypothetical protein
MAGLEFRDGPYIEIKNAVILRHKSMSLVCGQLLNTHGDLLLKSRAISSGAASAQPVMEIPVIVALA